MSVRDTCGGPDDAEQPMQGGKWGRAADLAPTAILALGLVILGFVLLNGARQVWFWRDDWAFVRPKSVGLWRTIVFNYNGHWSAVPWMWFRATRHLFGIKHYLPYAVVPVLLQIATFVLLYALLRRTTIGRWPAVIAVLGTAFLAAGIGAENTLWLATIGFLGSCAFGLLALLLADLNSRMRWLAPFALLLAVMCSNVGLIMVAFAAGWSLARRGLVSAIGLVVGPVVVYVAWFLRYARIRPPAGSGRSWNSSPPVDWGHGTHRMLAGIADVWRSATGVPGAGILILLLLLAAVLVVRRERALAGLGAAGLVALVFGFALFGFGKASPHTLPTQPRYEYVGVLVCGGAVACLMQAVAIYGRKAPWASMAAGAIVVVLAGGVGVTHARSAVNALQPQTTELRNRVLATAWLAAHGETFLNDAVWPDPKINHGVTVSMLTDPAMKPFVPVRRPTEHALLITRAQTQVGVGPTAFDVPQNGCADTRRGTGAPITIHADASGRQIRVRFAPTGASVRSVRTRLVAGSQHSTYMKWRVDAQRNVYVAISAPHMTLDVLLPRGATVVCTH